MDLPALACTSNLHELHQNKNHSLNTLKHVKKNPNLKLVFTIVGNQPLNFCFTTFVDKW